jgi:hypothetical protein
MSFAFRTPIKAACIFALSSAAFTLLSCNSKEEKVVHPRDPEVPAIFAKSEYDENEKKELMDQAVADLQNGEAEADRELEAIKARIAQRKKERKENLAAEQMLTQEEARKDFKGTRFDSLKLNNGDSFYNVTVMSADDIGVTISHRDGARRIKYADLPEAIQQRCQYTQAALN